VLCGPDTDGDHLISHQSTEECDVRQERRQVVLSDLESNVTSSCCETFSDEDVGRRTRIQHSSNVGFFIPIGDFDVSEADWLRCQTEEGMDGESTADVDDPAIPEPVCTNVKESTPDIDDPDIPEQLCTNVIERTPSPQGISDKEYDSDSCIIISPSEEDILQLQQLKELSLANSYYKHYVGNTSWEDQNLYLNELDAEERSFIDSQCHCIGSDVLYVYGEGDRPVYLSDFALLLKRQQLNTAIVDACLDAIRSRSTLGDVNILDSYESHNVLCESFQIDFPTNSEKWQHSVLVIPYHPPGHWALCIADMNKKILSIADSDHDSTDGENILMKLLGHISHRNKIRKEDVIDVLGWRVHFLNVDQQKDSHSCGVYMLWFIHCFVNNMNMEKEVDICNTRLWLARECLSRAKSSVTKVASRMNESNIGVKFKNGLFQSADYYTSGGDCVVATFGQGLSDIAGFHLSALVNSEKVHGDIIDVAIHTAMTALLRKSFINFRHFDTRGCLECPEVRARDREHVFQIAFGKRTLIMPYGFNDHWFLIVADLSKKEYSCYDSLQQWSSDTFFNEFLHFIDIRDQHADEKIGSGGWRTTPMRPGLPKQSDAVHCGMYVILYAMVVMGIESAPADFSPSRYRQSVAHKILENSMQMWHLCVKCGKNEFDGGMNAAEMLQCEECCRWVHHKCDKCLHSFKKDVLRSEKFHYICVLCTKNGRGKSYLDRKRKIPSRIRTMSKSSKTAKSVRNVRQRKEGLRQVTGRKKCGKYCTSGVVQVLRDAIEATFFYWYFTVQTEGMCDHDHGKIVCDQFQEDATNFVSDKTDHEEGYEKVAQALSDMAESDFASEYLFAQTDSF
ncbi:transposon, CACTA, En Spm sub-class, partial [Olea europaea subsp. europaea]